MACVPVVLAAGFVTRTFLAGASGAAALGSGGRGLTARANIAVRRAKISGDVSPSGGSEVTSDMELYKKLREVKKQQEREREAAAARDAAGSSGAAGGSAGAQNVVVEKPVLEAEVMEPGAPVPEQQQAGPTVVDLPEPSQEAPAAGRGFGASPPQKAEEEKEAAAEQVPRTPSIEDGCTTDDLLAEFLRRAARDAPADQLDYGQRVDVFIQFWTGFRFRSNMGPLQLNPSEKQLLSLAFRMTQASCTSGKDFWSMLVGYLKSDPQAVALTRALSGLPQ